MAKISEALRGRLIEQLARMYAKTESEYPDFMSEARRLLPAESATPRFGFIVRRLWMDYGGEAPSAWRQTLAGRYREFEEGFAWEGDLQREPWIDAPLVEKTLSVWQRQYPYPLKVRHAVNILADIGKLPGQNGESS